MARPLAALALLAGGGLLAYLLRDQLAAAGAAAVYNPVDLDYAPPLLPVAPGGMSADYFRRMSLAEDPRQDPYAKNPYSSASGLYQFTKATWTGLGGDWGPDPTKAFGGLRPSAAEQHRMAERLTAGNAGILARAGQAVNDMTLYAVHIFGPKAVRVLGADPSTPLADLVGRDVVRKNPALGHTVASFWDYLARKVG